MILGRRGLLEPGVSIRGNVAVLRSRSVAQVADPVLVRVDLAGVREIRTIVDVRTEAVSIRVIERIQRAGITAVAAAVRVKVSLPRVRGG